MITYRSGIVEHSKDCYRSWGVPYVVTRVTVNNGPGMVRFVMVGLPIDHRELLKIQDELYALGLDVPLLDIINCGLMMHDILDTAIVRRWMRNKNPTKQRLFLPDLEKTSDVISSLFSGLMASFKLNCKAIDYDNGELLLEISRDVKWDELNRFEPKR